MINDYITQRNYLAYSGRYETESEFNDRRANEKIKAQTVAAAESFRNKAEEATQKAVAAATPKKYRILRFIEYTGSLEWVNDCVARRGIKGTRDFAGNGHNVIREGILGDAAELLEAPALSDFRAILKRMEDFEKDLRCFSLSQSFAGDRAASIRAELHLAIKKWSNR